MNSEQWPVIRKTCTGRYAQVSGIGSVLILLVVMIVTFAGSGVAPVFAQDQQLTLGVSRNFGYSSGGDIRGSMTMNAQGPNSLQSVDFLIDGKVVGVVKSAPFRFQFNTTDFPNGYHDLSAVGHTSDGQTLPSNVRHLNFASAEEESAAMQRIVFPLLGFVGVLMAVMIFVQFWSFRPGHRKRIPLGAPRSYGILGGAVCPKCGRPYAIHWWAFNVIGGRLDRCEHCGQWVRVTRRPLDELRKAEAAELAMAQPEGLISAPNREDQLRQQLDDSKFTD